MSQSSGCWNINVKPLNSVLNIVSGKKAQRKKKWLLSGLLRLVHLFLNWLFVLLVMHKFLMNCSKVNKKFNNNNNNNSDTDSESGSNSDRDKYLTWIEMAIDLIRILTVGLKRACDGGSCGGSDLHLKRFPRIGLSLMLVSSTTVRIRICANHNCMAMVMNLYSAFSIKHVQMRFTRNELNFFCGGLSPDCLLRSLQFV